MSEILRAPNPRNPRVITDERIETLTKALATFGDLGGIVYNTRSKQTVGGHQRLRAFQSDDNAKIEITKKLKEPDAQGTTAYGWVVANGTRYAYREVDWPVDVETAAMLAANKFSGEWDNTALEPLLVELNTGGFDMELTGFDVGDLADFKGFQPPESDAEPQISKADELQKKWGTKTGQLWKIGEHRLLCGDSTKAEDWNKIMMHEKGHMIFTDPPYGVDYDGGAKKREKLKDDHIGTEIYNKVLPLIASNVDNEAPLYLWYADGHAAAAAAAVAVAGYEITAQIIWAKNHAQFVSSAHYHGKHEPCYYAHKKGKCARWHGDNNEVTLWECDRSPSNDFHPTQKPIPLALRAIKNSTTESQIVIDGFLGGGTTMVACENLGRKCRGIEISPGYCAVILERMVTAFPHLSPELMP